MRQIIIQTIFTVVIFSIGSITQAYSAIYDEAVDGDLNNMIEGSPFISPGTVIGTLGLGPNTVKGIFGDDGAGNRDMDVFTFTIPSNHQLTSIHLLYNIVSGDEGNGSYFAINDGVDIGTGLATAGANLSDALINTSGEIMDDFEAGPYAAGTGLTSPLGTGEYTMFLSEISAVIDYQLTLTTTVVPLPAAFWLFASSITGISLLRTKRRTT